MGEEIKAYVKGVFNKFDDNHSGALSFKESREFIEGLIDFFDQEGQISNTELSDILKSVNAQEMDNNSSESDTIEVIESSDPVLAPVENVPSSPEMIDVDDVPESVVIKTPQEPVEVPVADKVIPAVETAEPVAPVASEEKPVVNEAVAATDDATDNAEESVSNVVESDDNDKLAPGTAADSVTAEEPTGDKTEVTTVDTSPAEVEIVADIATDIEEQGAVKQADAVDVTDQVEQIETAADSDTKAIVVDEPVSQEASADIVVSETEPISATAANDDVSVAQAVKNETEVVDNAVTSSDAVEPSAENVVVADENVPEVDQPVANVTEADVSEVSEVPDASVEAVEPTATEVTVDSTVTSEEVEQTEHTESVDAAQVSESSVISNEIEQIKDVEPVVDALISEDAEQTTTPDAQPKNVATNESTAEPTVEDPIPAAVKVLDELVVTPDEPTPVTTDPVEAVPDAITVDPVEPSSEPMAAPTEVVSEVAVDTAPVKTPSPEPIADPEEVVPEVVADDTPPAKSPSPIPPATPSPTPVEVKPVSPKPVSPVPSPALAVTTPTPAAPKSTKTEGKPVDSTTAQTALAYACLILADDDLSITADNLIAILKAANVSIDGFMARIYEQALATIPPKQLIASFAGAIGGGGGAQAQAATAATSDATPAKAESVAPSESEEDDDDFLGGLF